MRARDEKARTGRDGSERGSGEGGDDYLFDASIRRKSNGPRRKEAGLLSWDRRSAGVAQQQYNIMCNAENKYGLVYSRAEQCCDAEMTLEPPHSSSPTSSILPARRAAFMALSSVFSLLLPLETTASDTSPRSTNSIGIGLSQG